jgi:hypothetical protein
MSFANPYEQQQNERAEAYKGWKESEWRLNFLRTQTGTPSIAQPSDQEILKWYQAIQSTPRCN